MIPPPRRSKRASIMSASCPELPGHRRGAGRAGVAAAGGVRSSLSPGAARRLCADLHIWPTHLWAAALPHPDGPGSPYSTYGRRRVMSERRGRAAGRLGILGEMAQEPRARRWLGPTVAYA